MSYVDDVIETIIEQNPSEPEFHQAVREVLESLRVVIEENEEEFKKEFSDLYKKWNDEMQSIDRDVFDHAGWFDQINLYEENGGLL